MRRGISWLAEWLLTSQEWPCSMELVTGVIFLFVWNVSSKYMNVFTCSNIILHITVLPLVLTCPLNTIKLYFNHFKMVWNKKTLQFLYTQSSVFWALDNMKKKIELCNRMNGLQWFFFLHAEHHICCWYFQCFNSDTFSKMLLLSYITAHDF